MIHTRGKCSGIIDHSSKTKLGIIYMYGITTKSFGQILERVPTTTLYQADASEVLVAEHTMFG